MRSGCCACTRQPISVSFPLPRLMFHVPTVIAPRTMYRLYFTFPSTEMRTVLLPCLGMETVTVLLPESPILTFAPFAPSALIRTSPLVALIT